MSDKKLIIRTEIDIGEIQLSLYRLYQKVAYPLFYLIFLALHGGRLPRTPRAKNGAYTAKNDDFEARQGKENPTENGRGVGGFEPISPASIFVKCANPECSISFEPVKRGNQEKKFCGNTCKDVVNNSKKKMGVYYGS